MVAVSVWEGETHPLPAKSVRVAADLTQLCLVAILWRGHVRCSVNQRRHILSVCAAARSRLAKVGREGSGKHG